jgi:hypothetical protein
MAWSRGGQETGGGELGQETGGLHGSTAIRFPSQPSRSFSLKPAVGRQEIGGREGWIPAAATQLDTGSRGERRTSAARALVAAPRMTASP